MKCFYCEELGHIKSICPKAMEDLNELKKTQRKCSVSLVATYDDVFLLQRDKGSKEECLLDSV